MIKETEMIQQNREEILKKREIIDNEYFISIWPFMSIELNLSGAELFIYAVIFSMYYNNACSFSGSRKYLQVLCNVSKTTVENALRSLEEKELIVKNYSTFGGFKKATYTVNEDSLPDIEKFALIKKGLQIRRMIDA